MQREGVEVARQQHPGVLGQRGEVLQQQVNLPEPDLPVAGVQVDDVNVDAVGLAVQQPVMKSL